MKISRNTIFIQTTPIQWVQIDSRFYTKTDYYIVFFQKKVGKTWIYGHCVETEISRRLTLYFSLMLLLVCTTAPFWQTKWDC